MRSVLPGISWPAVIGPRDAQQLALAWQLEQSQWWTPAELRAQQARQLAGLLRHAATTVPYYEDAFAAAGWTADKGAIEWSSVPILTRQTLIDSPTRIISRAIPPSHGRISDVSTSRTSGAPVRLRSTEAVSLLWQAVTLREHLWHRRDLSARLGVIRYFHEPAMNSSDGVRRTGWGPATAALAPDAPLSAIGLHTTTEQQAAWLVRENPTYLLVYPTMLDALLRRLAVTGDKVPALREVRTISEALTPETRALCREVLGVPVVDTYSAQEVGYIALQCPDRPDGDVRYHVQSERLIVEILADDGTPCRPGEIGRVVVTDLHNYATPLLRYDIGDYAEVGEACTCGRGLPVLTRVVGRRRGMLAYPDGRLVWPLFTVACRNAARYREVQLVQERIDMLRLRVVADPASPLGEADHRALTVALQAALAFPFEIAIDVVDALSRSPAGKLEEFVSLVKR